MNPILTLPKKYMPKPNDSTIFVKEGHEYCIINQNGFLYAIDNLCPHKGGSLGLGVVKGDDILCPLHEYRFNFKTGHCNIESYKIQTYDIEIES